MKHINLQTSLAVFRSHLSTTKGQRGVSAAIAMLSMVALFGAGSMAIDVSHQRNAGVELQNAADASALAGATALDGTEGGITDAVNRALATVNAFDFDSPITMARADIRFARSAADFESGAHYSETEAKISNREAGITYIRVKIPNHYIKTLFTHLLLNKNELGVTREATAGISFTGLIPPASDSPEGTLPVLANAGPGFNTLSDWVPLALLQDAVNQLPLNVKDNCGDPYKFTPGCTYRVHAGTNGLAPGDFQALAPIYDFGMGDAGSADLRTNLVRGVKYAIHPGDWITTQTGLTADAVKQGLDARFGNYLAELDASAAPPDVNVKEGITFAQYRAAVAGSADFVAPAEGTGVAFRRVIMLPIINNTEFNEGRDKVQLYDLAPFFLRTQVNDANSEIELEYLGGAWVSPHLKYDPSVAAASNGGRIRTLTKAVMYK
jgi:hypothetical protein